MKQESLFNASFEESLNLEDDGFFKFQKEQHEKTLKYFKGGKISIWFRISSFLWTVLFPVGFNALLLGFSIEFHKGNALTVPISKFSLLTVNVYLCVLFVWLCLVLLGKLFKQHSLLPYRYQFHVYTFMIGLVFQIDLLVTEFLLPQLSWGVGVIYVVLGIIGYFMHKFTIRRIKKLLYNQANSHRLGERLLEKISIYASVFLTAGVVLSLLFRMFLIDFSTLLKITGLLFAWFFINIGAIAVVICIGYPYFLQAYYKWKYPVEYREWEGKSVEEWYGKKYLKRHKELL